jgi:hypothetical protein
MAEKNLGDLKAKFKVDVDQLEKLVSGITKIRGDFDFLNRNLDSINTKLKTTLATLQGIQQAGGVKGIGGAPASNPAAGGINLLPHVTNNYYQQNNTVNSGSPAAADGGGGIAGQLASSNPYGKAAFLGMQAITSAIQAMNARMDNNYARSLSADKLGVYYQQTKGISQTQYANQMRAPLTDQRLGYGGISTLLALQASTGISAQGNAAGFAAMRASSGYSIGTDQLAQQAATLAGPAANNRMTMMLGTGMYGPGGQQRSSFEVMQQVVQRTGLLNDRVLKGARQQGSNTRAMLLASGVPEDMVEQYLDYAEQTQTYKKKTGKTTLYDPSKAADRRIMGIEDNFSSQAEETARVSEKRDENYYARQSGNLAQFEKNTQAVTEALGALEEKLNGLVGLNISTRNAMWRKAANSVGGLFGFNIGDPPEAKTTGTGGGAKVPMGYGSPPKRVSLGELGNSSSFRTLNSTFKDRLLRMFADNPQVGLGVGTRSSEEQSKMFFSRYKKVTDGSEGDVNYNGEAYKHVSGAPAAPPGRSMHEIGLAADLVGDLDWVQDNAAKYGLKTFGKNLGEPWHIQPAELPDSRWEYEKQGSAWGQPAGTQAGSQDLDARGNPTGAYVVGDKVFNKFTPSYEGGVETYNNQTSIAEIVALGPAGAYSAMGGGMPSDSVSKASAGLSSSASPESQGTVPKGAMDPKEIALALARRKFPGGGKTVTNMLAIAGRESNWQPGAYNGVGVDNSYGLFQINMKGDLGPKRLKDFRLTSNEQLFDWKTNIKAARILFGDGNTAKGGGYFPWKAKGGDWKPGTEDWMPKAQAVTRSLGIDQGDPVMNQPSRGGTNVQVSGGTSVTIAPNIYVTSTGNNPSDAYRMAQELARLIDNDLKRELLRTT